MLASGCHRHWCLTTLFDSPTLLHLPFNAASPICVLRSCMVASPPHYDGLGGWASIRKGMYLRRRPATLFKAQANRCPFHRISPTLYEPMRETSQTPCNCSDNVTSMARPSLQREQLPPLPSPSRTHSHAHTSPLPRKMSSRQSLLSHPTTSTTCSQSSKTWELTLDP